MNYLDADILKQANTQAVYNLYLYLSDKVFPKQNETLISAVNKLDSVILSDNDRKRLSMLHSALHGDIVYSKISDYTYSKRGLTACVFKTVSNEISVVFKGTGSGEWIDNGEGLSGTSQENTYIIYENGKKTYTRKNDFATTQQAEALNWFEKICHLNGWNENSDITVSGHSKGGNKAQFITIHSSVVKKCLSFNGQGFSPEALTAFKKQFKETFEQRKQKIMSFCADNDYVNVLGKRLMPENQVYYFESVPIFHQLHDMMNDNGLLNPQCRQGVISEYVQYISDELMTLPPDTRQYVTRAVMNIFQKYLGEKPLNGDFVSIEETVAGIAIAVSLLLRNFKKTSL